MKTTLSIKNFRVFDENGVDIDLAPITILTGKNSAGKSSIVKAIAILNSFLEQIRRDKENGKSIELHKYKIQFNELFEGTLGNFKSVLHKGAKNHKITFEYIIHSTMLFEDVKVSFSFKDADEGEDTNTNRLHYGILSSFSVKTLFDEVIYYSNDEREYLYNLDLVKSSFFDFSIGEFLAYSYLGAVDIKDKNEMKMNHFQKSAKGQFDKLDEKVRKNILRYLRDPMSSSIPIIENGEIFELIYSTTREGKQIFQVPVIDEYFKELPANDISVKVDEILNDDTTLQDAEKYIIKRFIDEVHATGMTLVDFWHKQEDDYLNSVGKDSAISTKKSPYLWAIADKNGFIAHNVSLPDSTKLSVWQELWTQYPGLYTTKNEDKRKKAKDIDDWKERPLDTFPRIYEVLMRLNSSYERWMNKYKPINLTRSEWIKSHRKCYLYEQGISHPEGRYTHIVYKLLCEYASRAIENLLFPVWAEHFLYIPSSRALPKRIYTPETGKDFYTTLKDYLIAKTEYDEYTKDRKGIKNKYVPDTFLNKWIGKDGFDIGRTISVESIMGAAIIVKLIKEDGDISFLTDEGFGLTQLVSMLIRIETAILKARGVKYNNYYQLTDLDNLNTNKFYYEQQTIAVEEPEIHLHPDFQSKLANMFVDASEYNIHFIIETHSEYLIRKLQVMVADKKNVLSSDKVSLNYVGENESGVSSNRKIEIQEDGALSDSFGSGFYDEADTLAIQLFRNKPILS